MKLFISFKDQKSSQEFVNVFNDCLKEYTDVTIACKSPKNLLLKTPVEWDCFTVIALIAEILEFCDQGIIIDKIEFMCDEVNKI